MQLKIYTTDVTGAKADASEQYVNKCSDGSYCCGAEKPFNQTNIGLWNTCCEQKKGFFILNNGTVSTVDPNATDSPTNGTAPPTPPPPPPPAKSNTGAIVGGVVGGLVGLAILAAAVLFFQRRRRPKTQEQHPMLHYTPDEAEINNQIGSSPQGQRWHEMGGNGQQQTMEKDGAAIIGDIGSQKAAFPAPGNLTAEKDGAPMPHNERAEMNGTPMSPQRDGPYEL